jgi:hypothetical protein
MTAITLTKTTAGRNLLRDSNSGANNDLIKCFAIGTGSTAPSSGDTALTAEVFRKAITSYVNGADGEVLVNVYLAPSDAVGVVIAEIGVFGGNSASSLANSGVLLARGLYSHTKTNVESIVLQFDLTYS